MNLIKEQKQSLIGDFAIHAKDTGSANVQIAILTERIKHLTDHFRTHKKDHHSRRGLVKMVSQRRSLLSYVKKSKPEEYLLLIKKLKLRK
ncbi:MAG: 30S ribosomal protein S15 [Candidatus Omnitrophota bacterium]